MSSNDSLWNLLVPGVDVSIVKSHYTPDRPDYSYPARVIESDRPGWLSFEAAWALPDMDVDGILYETRGRIIEYFSPDQLFNIFHVFQRSGASSGFYANVSELPTLRQDEHGQLVLTWIDCWLDVIKLPNGEIRLLDENDLAASGVEELNPELATRIRMVANDVLDLLSSDGWQP